METAKGRRFVARGLAPRAAVALGRLAGRLSRAWGQRGLGTLFAASRRVPGFSGATCRVVHRSGATFELEVFEPYWGPVLVAGRAYEPEVLHTLRRFASLDPVLVDCGANVGFWSVIASAPEIGLSRVVAIEPNPTTYRRLLRNAELNGGRYHCVKRAVSHTSGETVQLVDAARHAVARIGEDPGGTPVETITVDAVLADRGWVSPDDRILLKLDVEGHELAALEGARATTRRDHAIIFEELTQHGFCTFEALLARGYAIYDINARGTARALADRAGAQSAATAAGRLGRARNFVASSPGGKFARVLEGWAREAV
ncbi:MAG: FkbM family methyltransferase [Myxococcales bacterium]|nr:FkbM family methyltransferase [Myxococcales bacterium]